MLERVLKMLSQGQHVIGFKGAFLDDQQTQQNKLIIPSNDFKVTALFSAVTIYSRVVVDSFNKFKENTVISIQRELISMLF